MACACRPLTVTLNGSRPHGRILRLRKNLRPVIRTYGPLPAGTILRAPCRRRSNSPPLTATSMNGSSQTIDGAARRIGAGPNPQCAPGNSTGCAVPSH